MFMIAVQGVEGGISVDTKGEVWEGVSPSNGWDFLEIVLNPGFCALYSLNYHQFQL